MRGLIATLLVLISTLVHAATNSAPSAKQIQSACASVVGGVLTDCYNTADEQCKVVYNDDSFSYCQGISYASCQGTAKSNFKGCQNCVNARYRCQSICVKNKNKNNCSTNCEQGYSGCIGGSINTSFRVAVPSKEQARGSSTQDTKSGSSSDAQQGKSSTNHSHPPRKIKTGRTTYRMGY